MAKKQANNQGRKKHPIRRAILLGLLCAAIAAGCVFSYFGGFGTGECADTEDFRKYAASVDELSVPASARMIAFGEATHGNAEFQQLKLDVFKRMVENNGVRAFALEGDCGGCEAVNRYIHGGEGTAEEAAAAIGFEIYRTSETAELIEWMREYDRTAAPGEDLRFYGFDMQRIAYNYQYLLEAAEQAELDTSELVSIWDGDGYSDAVDRDRRAEVIKAAGEELAQLGDEISAHYADILLQNNELGKIENFAADGNVMRDKLMAENALWILEQEQQRGNSAVFLAGHNGHMKQFGSYGADSKVMGNILADELGDDYFVIGTDFYRSSCALPDGSGRSAHTFFSRDPLAKAAKRCGYDMCWLDFSAVPEGSALSGDINEYQWMGTLGDVQYSPLIMNALPMSYRVWQKPTELYDGMIFVTNAHPTEVKY